jgi:hypothetical protein
VFELAALRIRFSFTGKCSIILCQTWKIVGVIKLADEGSWNVMTYIFFSSHWSSAKIMPSHSTHLSLFYSVAHLYVCVRACVRERERCNWNAKNIMRMNFGNRWGIVGLHNTLAEDIWPGKIDQINADVEGNWYEVPQKKIDQQMIHGLDC